MRVVWNGYFCSNWSQMISKNQVQYIKSLAIAKFRTAKGQFIAEGPKLVCELLSSHYGCEKIFALPEWIENNRSKIKGKTSVVLISRDELNRISLQKTPNQVLAIINIPEQLPFNPEILSGQLVIMLDGINDPGNLGTIIRTADWFGISHIICSVNCADVYNPKVVQATMGSVFRVNVWYESLKKILEHLSPEIPVYGTVLDGISIYQTNLSSTGVVIIGSESHGISSELKSFINTRISIPGYFVEDTITAESLNASVATALVIAEFRRRLKFEK